MNVQLLQAPGAAPAARPAAHGAAGDAAGLYRGVVLLPAALCATLLPHQVPATATRHTRLVPLLLLVPLAGSIRRLQPTD